MITDAIKSAGAARKGGVGPVRTLVEAASFDRIYLLSNYPKDITRLFLGWLEREAEARYTSLSDPTNYGEIFAAVDTEMRAITQALDGKKYELFRSVYESVKIEFQDGNVNVDVAVNTAMSEKLHVLQVSRFYR